MRLYKKVFELSGYPLFLIACRNHTLSFVFGRTNVSLLYNNAYIQVDMTCYVHRNSQWQHLRPKVRMCSIYVK